MKQSITADERLQAFALFVMACQHAQECRRYERAIAKIFGDTDEFNSRVSDSIYGGEPNGAAAEFDEILEGNEIKVE
jgi:hypothetical protein